MVAKGTVAGRECVHVTTQIVEGFSHACHENCCPEWKTVCDKMSEDPNFEFPKSLKKDKDPPELEK